MLQIVSFDYESPYYELLSCVFQTIFSTFNPFGK